MAIPDRSELPPEFVDYIDKQNADFADWEPPKPILPADTTPDELVEAAHALDNAIQHHRNDGSLAAELIEREWRQHINNALERKITEPLHDNWRNLAGRPIIRWGDTDLYEPKRKDLERTWVHFNTLITGIDRSTPGRVASVLQTVLHARKLVAQRKFGLDLDLTDEEWWQI